jgi:hypothetical protein
MIAVLGGAALAGSLASSGAVMPTPAALTLLDPTHESLAPATTAADFAAAASELVSEDGSPSAGGALEFSLRALGATRRMSPQDYADHYGWRLISRSHLSIATVAGEGDDVRPGAGLRLALIDRADPLLDPAYAAAARKAVEGCDPIRTAQAPDWAQKFQECVDVAYRKYAAPLGAGDWNALGLHLAIAWAGTFPDGSLSAFQSDALRAWTTLVGPVGEKGQLGAGLGWQVGISKVEGGGPRAAALGRLSLGRTRLGAELGLEHDLGEEPATRYPLRLGAQVGFDADVWIHSDVGLVIDPGQDEVELLSGLSLRWGKAAEADFDQGP